MGRYAYPAALLVSNLTRVGLERWRLDAACRSADPELFFHPEHERGQARRARDAAAKAVCAHCPVLEPCRDWALLVHEPYGVWGGLSEWERAWILYPHRTGD